MIGMKPIVQLMTTTIAARKSERTAAGPYERKKKQSPQRTRSITEVLPVRVSFVLLRALRGRGSEPLISFRGMSRRGKFITFEGLDGTGKSTQMRKLAAALRERGHKGVETREPGGTVTGEKIRKVLLDSGTAGLAPLAEMALMFASRAQHIAEVIEPGLAQGSVVLCDRFTDSTEAYQGSGRRLGSEPVRELHRVLWANLQP